MMPPLLLPLPGGRLAGLTAEPAVMHLHIASTATHAAQDVRDPDGSAPVKVMKAHINALDVEVMNPDEVASEVTHLPQLRVSYSHLCMHVSTFA